MVGIGAGLASAFVMKKGATESKKVRRVGVGDRVLQLLAEQASTAIRPWAISAEPSKGTVSLVRGERE